MTRLAAASLIAVCLLALGTQGCSNNPYPPADASNPILYLTLGDDPKTLDPTIAYDGASQTVVNPIYPSYLQFHYLKRDPFELELALGAQEPQHDPVSLTVLQNGKSTTTTGEAWSFRIKHGLHFQDDPCFVGGKGEEIVAA